MEEKEYDEMRKVWTGHVGFTLTSDTVMPRRSTFNSSELRARGISCPDRVVVGGQLPTLGARMAAGKVSIQASVDAYLEVILDEWDFSVVQLGRISKNRPLTGLALHIFSDTRYMWAQLCRTNEFHFEKYVSEVEKTYGDNVYHNKSHAADVTQSVHYMLSQVSEASGGRANERASEWEFERTRANRHGRGQATSSKQFERVCQSCSYSLRAALCSKAGNKQQAV